MQPRVTWHVESDNYLEVGGENGGALLNEITGEYPDDATVTATLKTKAGAAVAGVGTITMSHVADTTGELTAFRGFVDDTITLPVGEYYAKVVATKAGVKGTFTVPITVVRG